MKKETTPQGYDRWDKTCVKFTDTKTPKKTAKTAKKGK